MRAFKPVTLLNRFFMGKRVATGPYLFLAFFLIFTGFIAGCKNSSSKAHVAFYALDEGRTGLNFTNQLSPTDSLDVFNYLYYYNGAGVGAGDFNNDGKIDLFFAANQSKDKLFLNQGDLHFKDVTTEASIPQDGGWSTGISVIDINNDGLLDIYICRVGNYQTLHSHNQLLVCQGIDKNGIPSYRDEAKEYGLDFSGFSTQAIFFDYDMDGDLDLYLLNHSVHQNRTFGERKEKLNIHVPESGDRLYRNDGAGKFTDVTKQSGINSSVLGYGLGVAISDINLDGYPDIYVDNDFQENDYMYINQHNGTFLDESAKHLMHTSQYSMGIDVADVNNDGFPDIMTTDMLPSDPYILKRSLGEDDWELFYNKIGYGYSYQYTRNSLNLNRRNGMFSEIGLYSGIAATDWSWSPLLMDFDNDGLKDLFVSNGIPKRLNDRDFINYISNQAIKEKFAAAEPTRNDAAALKNFPEIKLANKFFRNSESLQFTDMRDEIETKDLTYSSGAVYADLDMDGDLDVVVNNIDHPAMLYQNTCNDKMPKAFAEVKLVGSKQNINAIGSKIFVFSNGEIRSYEKNPVRGFLSSEEIPIHIGLEKTKIDSVFLVWPDNSFQRLDSKTLKKQITISYHAGLPAFNYSEITGFTKNATRQMADVTAEAGLFYKHQENDFHEFEREPLIPHMISTEGPGLQVADFNHDGLEDVFIGGSKRNKKAIFLQDKAGKLNRSSQPDLDNDSAYEDVDACLVDVNHDGYLDLVVASGGNEYFGNDTFLTPRVYINDGKGNFRKQSHSFNDLFLNASCIVSYDFNGDGFPDLFIGGRSVPTQYGEIPRSYLLQNDGSGKFTDVTDSYNKELSHLGFVTKALWFDLNKDGRKDLIISLEWGGIVAFMNEGNRLNKKVLTDKKGWWNFILPVDLNGDGKIDLLAGNLGLNSRLKASESEPVKMYYDDFDGNGKKEQVLTYFVEGQEMPFANIDELEKQIPSLRKKFLYAKDFANASLTDIFSADQLKKAKQFSVDYFSNAVLMNNGAYPFETIALPWMAQLSSYRDAIVVDANGDSLPDILMVGNYYENNIQMGRYDADFGTLLINHGNGNLSCESINGLSIKGQVRRISPIVIGKQTAFILAKNNDSTQIIQFTGSKRFR